MTASAGYRISGEVTGGAILHLSTNQITQFLARDERAHNKLVYFIVLNMVDGLLKLGNCKL